MLATCVVVYPPAANANLPVPSPAGVERAVAKSLTSVHVQPFQASVLATTEPVEPPKNIPSFFVPAPSPADLVLFNLLLLSN